jgi:hypothetical protein
MASIAKKWRRQKPVVETAADPIREKHVGVATTDVISFQT